MTTYYQGIITGLNTTTQPGAALITNQVPAGWKVTSAVVLSQGSGSSPVGVDVTQAFNQVPVQVVPPIGQSALSNIVIAGQNGGGDFITQAPNWNLLAATILVLFQSPT